MIGFGVAHDQMVDGHRIDLFLQQWQPGVAEFGVAGVDQGGALASHQECVVGGAVAQAEFDVESAALPVQGTNGGAVRRDWLTLQ